MSGSAAPQATGKQRRSALAAYSAALTGSLATGPTTDTTSGP